MIKIEPYDKAFEEEYWNTVKKKIDRKTRRAIMRSCIKYLPMGFFEPKQISFKALVLAPYEKLAKAQAYIESTKKQKMEELCLETKKVRGRDVQVPNPLYQEVCDGYEEVAKSVKNKTSIRFKIVKHADLTVCPYCNRDYINCRTEKGGGVELDHFFNKSYYPVFAVCLYNLVPVCGVCNRIKSDKIKNFASPFDTSIDWDKEIVFTYVRLRGGEVRVEINAGDSVKENIEEMKIEEAYQVNDVDVKELLDKKESYSKTQNKEFQEVLYEVDLSEQEIKQAIFGPEITPERMRKKPLGKMLRDLHKELKIY